MASRTRAQCAPAKFRNFGAFFDNVLAVLHTTLLLSHYFHDSTPLSAPPDELIRARSTTPRSPSVRHDLLAVSYTFVFGLIVAFSSGSKRLPASREYSPLPWSEFFDEKRSVEVDDGVFNVYIKGKEGPLFYLLHGGGYSGLTWSCFAVSFFLILFRACLLNPCL